LNKPIQRHRLILVCFQRWLSFFRWFHSDSSDVNFWLTVKPRYGTEIPVASRFSISRPVCYEKFKSIIGKGLSVASSELMILILNTSHADDVYDRFERQAEVEKITLPRNIR
jgi:hypothetical protein